MGLTYCCIATGSSYVELSKIWSDSIHKSVPSVETFIWNHEGTTEALKDYKAVQGDYGKALLSKVRPGALFVTDADCLVSRPVTYRPSHDGIRLAMFGSWSEPSSLPGTEYPNAILQAVEELGIAAKPRICVAPWCFWVNGDISADWLQIYQTVRTLMTTTTRFEVFGMGSSIAVYNLLWWKYRMKGIAELLPETDKASVHHVELLPDRVQAAKKMWKNLFGEDYA